MQSLVWRGNPVLFPELFWEQSPLSPGGFLRGSSPEGLCSVLSPRMYTVLPVSGVAQD